MQADLNLEQDEKRIGTGGMFPSCSYLVPILFGLHHLVKFDLATDRRVVEQ